MHTVKVTTIIPADTAMLLIQHAFLSVTEALTHSHGLPSAAHCTGNTAFYHCGSKRHISVRVDPADRQTDRRDISIDQQSIQTHYLHITTHAADCTNLTHERADNHNSSGRPAVRISAAYSPEVSALNIIPSAVIHNSLIPFQSNSIVS